MDALISTDALAKALGAPGLHIVDATYFLPDLGRDARAEHEAGHIPGARFLDLASLVDPAASLPNAFPPADIVGQRLGALGIGADERILLYDNSPYRTAARAWFILRHYGLGDVVLLDGGYAKWLADGLPVQKDAATPAPAATSPGLGARKDSLRSLADMRGNIDSGAEQVLDARGAGRFSGEEAEIRPGMASGHIPGARNLPYGQLFAEDGTWKRGAALAAAFTDAGIDLDRPIVTTCGSGITAATLLFGLHLLGKQDIALYDGSWSEWGADPTTPKATGRAA